jgi:hypothetical protein
MPNPSMRAARPTITTDADGNQEGPRPTVGPADAKTVHAALAAQDASARTAPATAPAAPPPAPKSHMQQSMDNQELASSAMIDKLTQ